MLLIFVKVHQITSPRVTQASVLSFKLNIHVPLEAASQNVTFRTPCRPSLLTLCQRLHFEVRVTHWTIFWLLTTTCIRFRPSLSWIKLSAFSLLYVCFSQTPMRISGLLSEAGHSVTPSRQTGTYSGRSGYDAPFRDAWRRRKKDKHFWELCHRASFQVPKGTGILR